MPPPNRSARAQVTRCSTHPANRAGWRCTSCHHTLCPDCAALRRIPSSGSTVTVCSHCGGMAAPLTRPRRIRGYVSALPTFVASFFTMDGLTTLVALGLVISLLKMLPILSLLASAIAVAYMFNVINAAAQGMERLPDPTDFTDLGSLLFPVIRFWLALSYVWLPGVLYVWFVISWRDIYLDGPAQVFEDPFLPWLILAGIIYYPMALLVAAVSDSIFAVLDPRIGFSIIARMPHQYAGAAALTYLFMALGWAYEAFANIVVGLTPVPFVPRLVAEMVAAVFWLIPAWILGRMIYRNHHHFGLMLKGQDQELEWPDAVPRGITAPEGSQSKQDVIPPAVEGWSHQPGLQRAAHTMAAVPLEARQIGAPRREVAPIEIEGWSDRPDPGAGAAALPLMERQPSFVLEPGSAHPPAPPERRGPRGASTPAPPHLAADLQLSGPRSDIEIEFEDDPTDGGAPRETAFDLDHRASSLVQGAAPKVITGIPLDSLDTGLDPRVAGPAYGDGSPALELARPLAPARPVEPAPPPAASAGPRPPKPGLVKDLEQALAGQVGLAALTAYARCREAGVEIAMAPRLELRLAGVLERAREFSAAVAACRRAADQDLRGPFAARAILMGAQLYEQRLGEPRRAAALYRYLIEHFPSDPLTPRADEALRRLSS